MCLRCAHPRVLGQRFGPREATPRRHLPLQLLQHGLKPCELPAAFTQHLLSGARLSNKRPAMVEVWPPWPWPMWCLARCVANLRICHRRHVAGVVGRDLPMTPEEDCTAEHAVQRCEHVDFQVHTHIHEHVELQDL